MFRSNKQAKLKPALNDRGPVFPVRSFSEPVRVDAAQ